MKRFSISVILLSAFAFSSVSQAQDEILVLEGPYLGQTPPGSIPEVFAPGVVSTEHRDNSGFFSPDMKEFYFTRYKDGDEQWSFIIYRQENNRWRQVAVMPRVGRPTISPDGRTMHLGVKYMERTADGWSEVKGLGPMFEREEWFTMRLSSSAQGAYVFDDPKSGDVIRMSVVKDGVRQEPELLGKEINTGKFNAHPFIAPDGTYLIWDGERKEGFGDSDLWISFRQEDGSWGDAINLGDKINTSAWEASAFVTADGKFLLFNRSVPSAKGDGTRHVDIFWVSAQFIADLKSKAQSN